MALTLTETEWVRAHEGATVTFQAHQCQYKLATNYYKTLTFYIKRCVGVQFTHAPCVCSNDVSITYMYTCVWEMHGHPLICLRTLLVFVYKQHMFIPVLISDSFISWPFYLFLCQYSTNIPTGAYGCCFVWVMDVKSRAWIHEMHWDSSGAKRNAALDILHYLQ